MTLKRPILPLSLSSLVAVLLPQLQAQPVVTPWGNVAGIRVEGELMAFETAVRAVDSDWAGFVQSSKYNWEGQQTFTLQDRTWTCRHHLQGTALHYETRITDHGNGKTEVELETELRDALSSAGVFFTLNLPAGDYQGAGFQWILEGEEQAGFALPERSGSEAPLAGLDAAKGFRIVSPDRTLVVMADTPMRVLLRQDFVSRPSHLNDPLPRQQFVASTPGQAVADYQVYFELMPANAAPGTTSKVAFSIQATGLIDREPVLVTIAPDRPGRAFSGVSGNFRMQFPALDAQVVDYCLENLTVTWGRIAFPWNEWAPEEGKDAREALFEGKLSSFFYRQITMAQRLAREGIPVMVGIWNPPAWAVDHQRPLPKGQKLHMDKMQAIADSIADWLGFLKSQYGVEVELFSFNEPDYGVEVHHSPEEHATVNKVLGSTFARRGLITRMLIGDTGACTVASTSMVEPTLADPSIAPYLGGIAFHTYHGITRPDLEAWAELAQRSNLPLMVTESGGDSAAHRYPLIFTTPWFEHMEADDNLRIASICQPDTIMPWQLNADYSPLAGGGIYGDHGPLRPTLRFWMLQQLGILRPGAFWLPAQSSSSTVTVAALGHKARGQYAVHMTNNGASRLVTIQGIPDGIQTMDILVSDSHRGLEHVSTQGVVDGSITLMLESMTFTSAVAK